MSILLALARRLCPTRSKAVAIAVVAAGLALLAYSLITPGTAAGQPDVARQVALSSTVLPATTTASTPLPEPRTVLAEYARVGAEMRAYAHAVHESHLARTAIMQEAVVTRQSRPAATQARTAVHDPGSSSSVPAGTASADRVVPPPRKVQAPPRSTAASGAAAAVAFAYAHIGCPYVYGGTGPCGSGYDCSGFVQAAWASAGVSIPRDTYGQWAGLQHISASELSPGDLVFGNGFGHVMLYVGNGYVIHAPHTGANVEKMPLSYAGAIDGYARP